MIARATILAAAFGSCLVAGLAWAATPDETVENRKTTMKAMKQVGKALKAEVNADGSLAPMVPQADKLAGLGRDIAAMFPVGTESADDTNASPFIWINRADFEARSTRFAADSAKLAQLGHAGDKAGFADQWAVVANQCGACHRNFQKE